MHRIASLADTYGADLVLVGLDEALALWGAAPRPDPVRALLPQPRVLVVKDGARAATAYVGPDTYTCGHRRCGWSSRWARATPSPGASWRVCSATAIRYGSPCASAI